MIINNYERFVLKLPKLAIEFRVDLEQSVYDTTHYQLQTNTDFVFATGEIWVAAGTEEDMVIDSRGAGNMIETLSHITDALRSPKECAGLEQKISQGGICKWMLGYWDRIRDDSCTQDDESTYDQFQHLCAIAEDSGCLAIYKYDNEAIIDVTGQGYGRMHVIHAWSAFDSESAVYSAHELKHEICMAILHEKEKVTE